MTKPRTRHAQLTNEAFRELAEQAVLELYENSDTFELHDLQSWQKQLKNMIGRVNDHETGEDSPVYRGDPSDLQGAAEE